MSGEVKGGGEHLWWASSQRPVGYQEARLSVGRELSETLDAKLTGNVDSKGRWDVTGDLDKRLGNEYRIRERFRIDSEGNRSYTHRLDKGFSEHKARVGAEFSHNSEGMRRFEVDGGITSEAGRRHTGSVMYMRDADGERSGRVSYDYNGSDGFRAGADVGFEGDERTIAADFRRNAETGRGYDAGGVNWSSEKRHPSASGSVSRQIDEDTSLSGTVSRNMRSGDVSAWRGHGV